jgi:glycosyltransferase involved in cell wall biosynthesis
MASGLAVVAYDTAAAAEHIRHGYSGLVAAIGDAAEFTRLAAPLAGDRSRIAALGQAARAVTESLDWARVSRDFERVLLDVCHHHEAAHGQTLVTA